MKKLLLSTAAAVAVITAAQKPASAADLAPVPRRAAPVLVPYTWTGIYVGANVGGSIGVNSTTDTGTITSPFIVPGVGPIGTNTLFSESFRHTPTGAILGGQLGYNWQIGSAFLLGLEADWQGAWQKDTATVGACNSPSTPGFFAGPLVASIFGQCMTDEQKLTNFGTLRGRAGVIVDHSLWYVTGGVAWGTVKDSFAYASSVNPATAFGQGGAALLAAGPAFLPTTAGFSHSKSGWTIGGGVETKLWASPWSLKLEYLYVDLGSATDAFPVVVNPAFLAAAGAAGAIPVTFAGVTSSTRFTDNIFRVGLNYKIY
jgi:outer membrane immunogenic protein